MKKIRKLQILVYIVFACFMLQHMLPGMYEGFKEGSDAVYDDDSNTYLPPGELLPYVTLNKNIFLPNTDTLLVSGGKYTVQNISINAEVRVNHNIIVTPWWFKCLEFVLVFSILILIIALAKTVNKVLLMIYGGTMFSDKCINLIKKAGLYLFVFSVADYAFDWFIYAKQKRLLLPPLQIVNTVQYDFSIALIAVFIFIVAEAFKQGAKLKAEQDLTI